MLWLITISSIVKVGWSARLGALANGPVLSAPTVKTDECLPPATRGAKNGAAEAAVAASASFMNVYMCRHGITTWNLLHRAQGEIDTELADVGIEQARKTAEVLAKRLPQGVRYILSSDLKRARATAEIYAERFGCQVVVDPRLREPSLGNFEGLTRDRMYSEYRDVFERMAKLSQEDRLREPFFDGLESPFETSRRAEAAARDAASLLADGGACGLPPGGAGANAPAVLLVTHSKVLEAVLATVFGKFYEGVATTPCAFFQWRFSLNGTQHELGEIENIVFHDSAVRHF